MLRLACILLAIFLICSCTDNTELERLRRENAELKQQIPQSQSHNSAKNVASGSLNSFGNKPLDIKLDDPSKMFDIKIHKILTGEEAVQNNLVYKSAYEAAAKQNKWVVYFEVSIKNIDGPQEKYINHHDFKLEDNKGNTYSTEMTEDYITGRIHNGKMTRGGLSYHIYKGNYPVRLLYDTGFTSTTTGETNFAVANGLDGVEPIKSFK